MQIKVIGVGKLKERYLKEGIAEYQKRLQRFAQITLIEVSDEPIPDHASEAEEQQIMTKEGAKILAKVGARDYVIVLSIEGKQFPSEQFAQQINEAMVDGYSDITFIIGGSLGLADEVKQRADLKMSFGKLTLPHQLMRLVLLEQIYRAYMINHGSAYHK